MATDTTAGLFSTPEQYQQAQLAQQQANAMAMAQLTPCLLYTSDAADE